MKQDERSWLIGFLVMHTKSTFFYYSSKSDEELEEEMRAYSRKMVDNDAGELVGS
ncbi:hypothetical protein KO561_05200 [Radiobacillus kanasensis]|uniref:hypothetical protein n=1 Tax=Radiobacillus kanasensis TaxID=2844358 RepID=UPI001E4626B2|nr:hypothetical protein [Radiobacillus kanasensis]UFU00347.1 hypothetical protein KO561_05200 [Radiobacillus kanasensis]